MRRSVLVTYDIADPKRLRRVFKTLRAYGDHLQLSVFLCELSKRERAELEGLLSTEIHNDDDQVLLVDLGLAETTGNGTITALGKRYVHPERVAIIV